MPLPTSAAPATARLVAMALPAALTGLALLLSGCVDNGKAADSGSACTPLVKFSMPAGVSPQAVDGAVELPVQVSECALDGHALWAWSGAGDLDLALDVYEDESGQPLVVVPVQEGIDADCDATSVTVALVDDRGEIIDQDRTFVPYRIGG